MIEERIEVSIDRGQELLQVAFMRVPWIPKIILTLSFPEERITKIIEVLDDLGIKERFGVTRKGYLFRAGGFSIKKELFSDFQKTILPLISDGIHIDSGEFSFDPLETSVRFLQTDRLASLNLQISPDISQRGFGVRVNKWWSDIRKFAENYPAMPSGENRDNR